MIFRYPQVGKTTQALKDLIKINNDRIGGYQAALHQSANLDEPTRDLFKSVIEESLLYRQQLVQKVKQLDHDVRTSPNLLGKIYMAWSDLKVTFACDTQRAIINNCLFNEEIALHAYRAVLSKSSFINGDVLQLLTDHEAGLKRNYELLKCYREIRNTAGSSLAYFV